jgi:hypothetical protein
MLIGGALPRETARKVVSLRRGSCRSAMSASGPSRHIAAPRVRSLTVYSGSRGAAVYCGSGPFRESATARRRRSTSVPPTPAQSGPVVCLAVKPAGKPDAGNRHSGLMSGDGKRSVGPSALSHRARPQLYLRDELAGLNIGVIVGEEPCCIAPMTLKPWRS